METAFLALDDDTQRQLSKAAWMLKKRRPTAAKLLIEKGLDVVEQSMHSWEGEENKEVLRQLEAVSIEKADIVRELMEVEGRIASFDFAVFEAYRMMSNALIAYSGKRGQAERLASILASHGIKYDLTDGKAPNYDRLAAMYLFRESHYKAES